MKGTMLGLALIAALATGPTTAHAAEGPVHNYYCNGIPLGPCALPPAMTDGKVFEECQAIPIAPGSYYKRCINIRVIRNKDYRQ